MTFRDGGQIFTSNAFEHKDMAQGATTSITMTGVVVAEKLIVSALSWYMLTLIAKGAGQSFPD